MSEQTPRRFRNLSWWSILVWVLVIGTTIMVCDFLIVYRALRNSVPNLPATDGRPL